jgi:hypothetical protein
MKAALFFLILVIVASGTYGSDASRTSLEPKVTDLIGVWQPDKGSLDRLLTVDSKPRMRELILKHDGTFLLQGVPAKWIAPASKEMPASIGTAQGKWRLRRNWEGWELLLEAINVSLVVALREERAPYGVVVPCIDPKGSFEVVFRRSRLKE